MYKKTREAIWLADNVWIFSRLHKLLTLYIHTLQRIKSVKHILTNTAELLKGRHPHTAHAHMNFEL